MKQIIAVLAIISLFMVVGCQKQTSQITVTGNSNLEFDPDQVEITVGVSIVKPTAEEAQTEVSTKMSKIIDGLRYKGIEESDLSTEQLSVYEEQVWENDKYTSKGWRATQTLHIKSNDLTKAGTLVDVAVSNGANQVYGLNFGLSPEKETQYKKDALAAATANAKDKATTVADAAGAKLGKITQISLGEYYVQPYQYMYRDNMAVKSAAAEATQVLPSDVNVNGMVTITYEIYS